MVDKTYAVIQKLCGVEGIGGVAAIAGIGGVAAIAGIGGVATGMGAAIAGIGGAATGVAIAGIGAGGVAIAGSVVGVALPSYHRRVCLSPRSWVAHCRSPESAGNCRCFPSRSETR